MPARNEEDNLRKAIPNLLDQTVRPKRIFIINDGSTDKTEEILNHFCFTRKGKVDFISLPYHKESYVRNSLLNYKMATVLNHAFEFKDLKKYDYLMQHSSDMLLPENYIERIIGIMENRPKLVVASGVVEGEDTLKSHVRGVGRLYKSSFWLKYIKRFPENYTYESYPLYKARSLGLEVESFKKVVIEAKRKTRTYKAQYGYAMRELGYFPPFAVARSLLGAFQTHKIELLISYLFSPYREVKDKDIQKWLRNRQIRRLFTEFRHRLRNL